MKNRKAQFTILALAAIFVVLLIFSLLLPDIQSFIDDTCKEVNETTCDFANLIPFFIVVAILLTILFFGLPS